MIEIMELVLKHIVEVAILFFEFVGVIVTVAGIIALRAALTFLIHWEIKEENHEKDKQ